MIRTLLKRILSVLAIVVILLAVFIPVRDVNAASIYYVRKDGNDANSGGSDSAAGAKLTIQAALNLATTAGDTVIVGSGTYHEVVEFKGSGSGSNYITLQSQINHGATISGAGLDPTNGVITGYSYHHLKVDGFVISDTTNDNDVGIYFGTYADGGTGYYTVQNCEISNTMGSGILVISSWAYNAGTHISNVTIFNNEIYDVCNSGSMEGISLREVSTFEIKNNTIYDVKGQTTFGNNKECIGVGEGSSNGTIHTNDVSGGVVGIYIDAGAHDEITNIDVYSNYCHDMDDGNVSVSGTGIGIGVENPTETADHLSDIVIYNNLIINNPTNGFSVQSQDSTIGFTLINNTFYLNGDSTDKRDNWIPTLPVYSSCVIRNNIYFENSGYIPILFQNAAEAGITVEYNLFWDGDSTINASNKDGTNSVKANPMFSAVGTNFHIISSSPAINAGVATSAPTYDYEGNTRGVLIDIGAYEYIAASPPPTSTVVPPVPGLSPGLSEVSDGIKGINLLIPMIMMLVLVIVIIKAMSGGNIIIGLLGAVVAVYVLYNMLPGIQDMITSLFGS